MCFRLLAQKNTTLSGYAKDKGTGETLIGVTLYLKSLTPDSATAGTATNAFGYYNLSVPPGRYQLTIRYVGYRPQTVVVNLLDNQKQNFELANQSQELEEVVVSSVVKSSQTTDMSVIEIKPETIEKLPSLLGEPDVLRTIQLLPGVSGTGDASSGFNVRGGSADQNLVLLDEGIIYNASHLFGIYSVFNTDAINNVKLYKGGIPSVYGGRLSSVLDINQKEGNTKKLGGKATIGLVSSKLYLDGPFIKNKEGETKGSFMVAGRRSYADLFAFLLPDFRDNRLYFYDLNLKTNYQINSKNKLFLSGYFGRDVFSLATFLGTSWGNASGTLRWTSILSPKLFFQLSGIYSDYDFDIDNFRSGSEFRWSTGISSINIKPRLSWFVNSKNTLLLGIDLINYQFRPGQINPLENSPIQARTFQTKYASEISPYIDYEQDITNRFRVRYGLRFSTFQRLGDANINQYENGRPLNYDPVFDLYTQNQVLEVKPYTQNEIIHSDIGWEPRLAANYRLDDE